MILIYRGFGVIVIVFGVVALVAAGWLQATYHLNEHLHVAAMTAVFALLCIVFGQLDEGEATLFFIPVAYWGYLAVIIPAVYYGIHVYEQRLDTAAIKAELTDFFGKGRSLAPATASTAPSATDKAAAAAATAPATPPVPPTSTVSAPAAAPEPPAADQYQVPSMALDATTASSVSDSPPSAPRVPTFSWTPQSSFDPIGNITKKWLTGTVTLPDGTAVEAKMAADDTGIKVTIDVDTEADKRKVFVYEVDSSDANQELTRFRVKIDDAAPHQSVFYQASAHVTENEIETNFWDFEAIKRVLAGQAAGLDLGSTRAARGIKRMVDVVVNADQMQQYNRITAAADGTLSQLAHASSVIVELPLADGSDNFVEIDPRDAYVRTFVQEREQQLGTLPDAAANNAATDSAATNDQPLPDWCPRAKRPAEFLICNTPQLIGDENKMEALHHSLIEAGASPTVKPLVRSWLGRRNGCETLAGEPAEVNCIHDSYARFIGQLEQLAR